MIYREISKRLFAFAILTASCVALASSPAGIPPRDAQEALHKADAVFLGRVIKIEKDSFGYDSTAHVAVQHTWKGKELLSHVVLVDGTGGPTYPARIFKRGETYLFYLPVTEKRKALRADSYLHRVIPKRDAADDLAYLSKSHKP